MRRHVVTLVLALVVVAGGAGVAVANDPPGLSAAGPTSVSGTEATSVFTIADRTIRQVRYRDKGTLTYRFQLHNDGTLPVTVTGLAPPQRQPRLFHYVRVTDEGGATRFTVPAGGSRAVSLALHMENCETLSARAGSFVEGVDVRTSRAGVLRDDVHVDLPEELHTGSPREAFCPGSTATSRPPG
jgi:hypothetical protein